MTRARRNNSPRFSISIVAPALSVPRSVSVSGGGVTPVKVPVQPASNKAATANSVHHLDARRSGMFTRSLTTAYAASAEIVVLLRFCRVVSRRSTQPTHACAATGLLYAFGEFHKHFIGTARGRDVTPCRSGYKWKLPNEAISWSFKLHFIRSSRPSRPSPCAERSATIVAWGHGAANARPIPQRSVGWNGALEAGWEQQE